MKAVSQSKGSQQRMQEKGKVQKSVQRVMHEELILEEKQEARCT